MLALLKRWLQHPDARNLSLDDPRTTILRREIIRSNGFLEKLYREWYKAIARSLPNVPGQVVELGSGAGFLQELIPSLITSDMLPVLGLSLTMDAQCLPFADNTLRALVMVDVLHHLPCPRSFFREAVRCLHPGGALTMVEPWYSVWSKLIYTRLHHEPFDTGSAEWEFPESGPLSGANGAMPWMIFERDRVLFAEEFPQLALGRVQLLAPFRYLVSGGVSYRQLAPTWSFDLIRGLERLLEPWFGKLAMFARIELIKV